MFFFKYIPAVLADEAFWKDWALEQDGSTGTLLLNVKSCPSVEISSKKKQQTNREQLKLPHDHNMPLHLVLKPSPFMNTGS